MDQQYKYEKGENSTFQLTSISKNEIFDFNCPLDIERVNNYSEVKTIHLLKKQVSENDIRIVKFEKKIIGRLIPLAALESIDHSLHDDDHFLKVALATLTYIFESGTFSKYLSNIKAGSNEFTLAEIFPEDSVFFSYMPDKLGSNDPELKIPPVLFSKGYILTSKHNQSSDLALKIKDNESRKTVVIKFPNEDVKNYNQISQLLTIASYQNDTVMKFFFLYQIIELLMDDVLRCEYKIAKKTICSSMIEGDIKRCLDKLKETSANRKKINLLFDKYALIRKADANELGQSCSSFLKKYTQFKEEAETKPQVLLYEVRNLIFHSYGKLIDDKPKEALELVISELFSILPLLLCEFHTENRIEHN